MALTESEGRQMIEQAARGRATKSGELYGKSAGMSALKDVKIVNDYRLKKMTRINKTELAYSRLLDLRIKAGEIVGWKFESIKLRLADRTWYCPDFLVVIPAGALPYGGTRIEYPGERLEIHEVKGFWRDDARVKIKVAAEMYPEFRFFAVQYKKGSWLFEEFK